MPVTSCGQPGKQDYVAGGSQNRLPIIFASLSAAHFPASCTFTLSLLFAAESPGSGGVRSCANCTAQAAESNSSKSFSAVLVPVKTIGEQLLRHIARHFARKARRRSMDSVRTVAELFPDS